MIHLYKVPIFFFKKPAFKFSLSAYELSPGRSNFLSLRDVRRENRDRLRRRRRVGRPDSRKERRHLQEPEVFRRRLRGRP